MGPVKKTDPESLYSSEVSRATMRAFFLRFLAFANHKEGEIWSLSKARKRLDQPWASSPLPLANFRSPRSKPQQLSEAYGALNLPGSLVVSTAVGKRKRGVARPKVGQTNYPRFSIEMVQPRKVVALRGSSKFGSDLNRRTLATRVFSKVPESLSRSGSKGPGPSKWQSWAKALLHRPFFRLPHFGQTEATGFGLNFTHAYMCTIYGSLTKLTRNYVHKDSQGCQ